MKKHYIPMLIWALAALTLTNNSNSWLSIALSALAVVMAYRHLKGIIENG